MAKKKQPTITNAVEYFNNVITRCKFTKLHYADNIIFGKRKNYSSFVIIVPNKELLSYVIPEDHEICNNDRIKNVLQYISSIDENDWIKLDDEKVQSGYNIKIKIDNLQYDVEINKKIFPLRLLKKEYNNFYYKIKYSDKLLFFIKKIFINVIPNTDFTIMQVYYIL